MNASPAKVLIAGGGLAGSLTALAIAARRPDLAVTLVEANPHFGGNHIWSFFDSDLTETGRALMAPLVCHRWPAYDVAFPAYARTIAQPYNSIMSERLDAVVRAALPGERLLCGTPVTALDPTGATLADGQRVVADIVIDARGLGDVASLKLGWQKFTGRLLRLAAPHGRERPIIMDATVDQADGYRFVYVLPFGPDRLFVEDTYYTPDAAFDEADLERRIHAYAAQHGWQVTAIERREAAALPIAIGGDPSSMIGEGDVARIGMAGGLYQPMTGYSLPDAVRTATRIAELDDEALRRLPDLLRSMTAERWRETSYYRLLGRMLFKASGPAERYRMLQRFYALDEALIGRFYAGRSTLLDKARIVCGKPPVALHRAAKVMMGMA